MEQAINTLKRRIADLDKLKQKSGACHLKIQDAAKDRLDIVIKKIEKHSSRVNIDKKSEDAYQQLINEKSSLELILSLK